MFSKIGVGESLFASVNEGKGKSQREGHLLDEGGGLKKSNESTKRILWREREGRFSGVNERTFLPRKVTVFKLKGVSTQTSKGTGVVFKGEGRGDTSNVGWLPSPDLVGSSQKVRNLKSP